MARRLAPLLSQMDARLHLDEPGLVGRRMFWFALGGLTPAILEIVRWRVGGEPPLNGH